VSVRLGRATRESGPHGPVPPSRRAGTGDSAGPFLRGPVRKCEGVAQQDVALARCLMEALAWGAVVAVVGEGAGLSVQVIRPVHRSAAGVQHRQAHRPLHRGPGVAEPSLVAGTRQQLANGVIAGVQEEQMCAYHLNPTGRVMAFAGLGTSI
jgi:hypothetical protein